MVLRRRGMFNILAVFVFTIALGRPVDKLLFTTSSRQGYNKYGEHCGVNHGIYSLSGSGGGVPIDKLDRLRRIHDECGQGIGEEWYPNCFCNLQFIRGLTAAEGMVKQGRAEQTRRGLIAAFRRLPCRGPLNDSGSCRKNLFIRGPALLKNERKYC